MTSTNGRVGGIRKEVDYQKLGPVLLIASSLVLAVRTRLVNDTQRWACRYGLVFMFAFWNQALATQDTGPVLKPNKAPGKSTATILVVCDLACNWKLDGEAKGALNAG